jgi:cytochrome P450
MSDREPLTAEPQFPWRRGCPFEPPEPYEHRRAAPAITKAELSAGGEAWILTDYEQIRSALADPALSNDRKHPGFPSPIPVPPEFQTNASLLGMDAPQHTQYRKMVAAEFTTRRVQKMRPRIQEIVDKQLADFVHSGPPGDLLAGFALPVTLAVICELLGIPQGDHTFLHTRTRAMFGGHSTAAERKAAQNELDGYFREFVTKKYTNPGDDLISRLVQKHPEPEQFEQFVHLTRLLLNGGHESTASMITLGTLALLRHPEQLRMLREDPGMTEQAVEEMLRLLSITELTTARVAKEDLEIGGVAIAAGEGVFPSTLAANHDPDVFERPGELDITREARKHVAFGHGRHLCLGADLSRLELQIVFSTLPRRLPSMELAVPFEDIHYREGGLVYGVEKLPLNW